MLDLETARTCLQCAADAYDRPPTIESQLAHVIIRPIDSKLIIAFRGTANIQDWITDFEVWRSELGDGIEVHDGFWIAVQMVINQIKGYLTEIKPLGSIYVTGHSLGGAIAMLSAWLLQRSEFQVKGVYTFGQPRVGNKKFVVSYSKTAELGKSTWRFINKEDVVPRVPGAIMGFRHVGNEVFLPADGAKMRVNPRWYIKLVSDAVGLYQEWRCGRLALIADHAVTQYMNRLGISKIVSS